MSRVKSQPYYLRSIIYLSNRVQTLSPTSSSPLVIPVKKGEKILRGSLHSVRGIIGLVLETLVLLVINLLLFIFSFYNCWFMLMLLLLLFITSIQYTLFFNFYLYSVFVTFSMLCSIFFFLVLLRYCQYVLSTSHLCPSRILFLDAYTSYILHLVV